MSKFTPINRPSVSPSFAASDASRDRAQPQQPNLEPIASNTPTMVQASNTTRLQQTKTHSQIAEELISNSPKVLSLVHKSVLRNLSKWLEKHHPSITLETIKNESGSGGTYGNKYVIEWLNAPKEDNPYGRAAGKNRGGSAVSALLKSYGKPI